jgi:sugar phosphate isomerase/epimerase
MGIATKLEKAAMVKAAGAEFLTLGVADLLVPDKPEAEFEKNLARLKSAPLPVLACNSFIRPAHLRCVGPEANHDLVLDWAETTFRRMKIAGGKFIVLGSGGARKIPEGWTKEKADKQFVALLKRMGPLAETHGITVTVEQLQASECNYINRIGEAAELLRAVAHPKIRLLADLFHMAKMDDTPADLKAAMDVVVHVEIAEKKSRTAPGVHGDDFRPFFRVLREAKYNGAISIEGNWTDAQLAPAFAEIAKQAAVV